MYPNPQDVLPLPPRPDLEQYRRRAKDLARACRDRTADGIGSWAIDWVEDLHALSGLREDARGRARAAEQVATFARERLGDGCALTQAQFVIARAHGFPSWEKFARHIEALVAEAGGAATFEAAVDAIVTGDIAKLRKIIAREPELVHARSTREHRATLLHYVSANGVENYRQRTPRNIVAVARLLLDAGAEVDAEADVYGGGATTLYLTVTSAHPRAMGVQNELANLLLDRGARMHSGIVRDCLANGCPEAARHLVGRGAELDWAPACAIGDLAFVRRGLETRGLPADKELNEALEGAAWYGEIDVIALLLEYGVPVDTLISSGREGRTILHIAAYQGDAAVVGLLLDRGASVGIADLEYGTTPFVWALHAWLVEGKGPAENFRSVLWALAEAGAIVEPRFLEGDELERWPELLTRLAANRERKS